MQIQKKSIRKYNKANLIQQDSQIFLLSISQNESIIKQKLKEIQGPKWTPHFILFDLADLIQMLANGLSEWY